MLIRSLKKFLRKNKIFISIYYNIKRLVVLPLKCTPLKSVANTWLPLKDLFNPYKIFLFSKAARYSMGNYPRMSNVYELANDVEKRKLEGAYVECGVWKGGLASIMAAVAHKYGSNRKTWYVDSFAGMPEPTKEDIANTKAGKVEAKEHSLMDEGFAEATISDVEELAFGLLNLPRENIVITKGWFEQTLPAKKDEIGKIAILRLDADWYSSTMTILNELYDQVVEGGYIIIDDYGGWEGCRKAVHEFLDS